MAVKDVKNYFYTMLCQYIEEKQNLADFEEALKEGNITQEQMQEVMENVVNLETTSTVFTSNPLLSNSC